MYSDAHYIHLSAAARSTERAAVWTLDVIARGYSRCNVGLGLAWWIICGNLRPIELRPDYPEELDARSRDAVASPLRDGGLAALAKFSDRAVTSKAVDDLRCNRVVCFSHGVYLSTLKRKGKAPLNEFCLSYLK